MNMGNRLQDSSSGRKLEYLVMGWISAGINATSHVAKEGGKAKRCRSGAESNRNNTRSSGEGTELMETDRHLRTKQGLGVNK